MNLDLPIQPPVPHMLAKPAEALPHGDDWIYEPKWDGFRCTVFCDRKRAYLQSRNQKPLARYFPELEEAFPTLVPEPMVLDGEIVIATSDGLDFGALQMRIHPAESRVRLLADENPASFVAFDLLALGDEDLRGVPCGERRERLVAALADARAPLRLTPATPDRVLAEDWFKRFEGAGLDGVVAKKASQSYLPGVRGWLKIKHLRTADCVIGGYRWNRGEEGRSVGSLLLGLYDDAGTLQYVGHTSSFGAAEKRALVDELAPFVTEDTSTGFGEGRTPGEPSRWSGAREMSWVRLRPELVCEVAFDRMENGRFRHASTFQRWRLDKPPEMCTFDQISTVPALELRQVFAG